ncbi:T-cell receptor alpha chain V region RL-5 [Myotis brandtii]|nr:T-cell receptor alpha chain V region RL-5 [Myotis brandtii]
MLSATCSVLVIFLTFRVTNGDSVTQTEVPVTLTEGASVILNCNYQTTYSAPYLFWYVQYRSKAPSLLLKSSTEHQTAEHQGFQAKLVKSDRSFHLEKSSLQMSDSAVYYCALGDTVREAAGGAERKPRGAQVGSLGGSVIFSLCTVWSLFRVSSGKRTKLW